MSHEVTSHREDPPAGKRVRRLLPIARQLAGYRSAWLPADILAGLSVAAVALPIAIAYPAIAGLPPRAGLYAAILPSVAYALFGPSRQLMVGPDTATTMMLASALLALGASAPDQRVAAAAAFALAVGLCCVVAGFVGLGFIANFLLRPVLLGFLSGVAIDLLIGQIDRLTAVPVQSSGLVRPLVEFATKLDRLHLPTLLVGIGLFGVLRLLRRYAPRFPGPLLAVAIGILLAFAFDLPSRGVQLVGAIPRALPAFALPRPGAITIHDFALGTLSILVVSFGSGIVTARSFGAKNRYRVDANRELIGFGAANIASGLFGGFPVTSSDSRTAVNDAMGGRTQLAGLVAAAGLLAAMLFLGGLLAYLPVAALGAVIASAAFDLIDLQAFRSLWRLSRVELSIALVALFGVLSLGVLSGVIVAVGVTMAHLLWHASKPRDALLGRVPGRDGLYKLHRHPDAIPIPGLVIYLPQSSLVFFNAEYITRRLLKNARPLRGPGAWLVLDASAMNEIDITAVTALEDVRAELFQRGISAVGFAVTPSHMIRRRRCRTIRKPYSSLKESVGTMNKSIEAMPSAWLQRKVLQPCDSPPLLWAMYFATLVWPTSMPSVRSSPWMRGAPQSGLARLMSRISRRISSGILGLPPRRLDFQRQNDRNPARVPANHGLGPDDGQRIYNARNEAIQPDEHPSVENAESKSLRGSTPKHTDLLPENRDFRLKPYS